MSKLTHYQKNAKEAFDKGFTIRTHYDCIGSEVYEVYKYYLPVSAAKRVRWVKRYFQALDSDDIDIPHKRRKDHVEFAETALLMLNRIHYLTGKDQSIVAGSSHISPIPWAIFGEGHPGRMAKMQFSNIIEIANYYRNHLHGNCYPTDIHFRIGTNWATKLSKNFKKEPLSSPNFWLTVALLLTYDLIHNCGPDCNEFFELFTNDYHETPENFDLDRWNLLRCKILGVTGKIEIPRIPFKMRRQQQKEYSFPLVEVKKPFKAKTEIALISEGQDLAVGEITYPTIVKIHDIPTVSRDTYSVGAYSPLLPVDERWPEDIGMHGLGVRLHHRSPRHLGCDF